jgi:hypothetical protein
MAIKKQHQPENTLHSSVMDAHYQSFSCDACGNTFDNSTDLKRHQRKCGAKTMEDSSAIAAAQASLALRPAKRVKYGSNRRNAAMLFSSTSKVKIC